MDAKDKLIVDAYDLISKATRFEFPVRGWGLTTVEKRSSGKWCVCFDDDVLNNKGVWEFEPSPSIRTDDFKKRTQFSLEVACELAEKAAREIPDQRD